MTNIGSYALSPYLKTVFTSRADNKVLSLGTGQAKHCLTLGALAVNVSLAVAEFVFAKLEKTAEAFVLPPPFLDVPRKDTEKYPKHKSQGEHEIGYCNNVGG